jgi:hypothetical protein
MPYLESERVLVARPPTSIGIEKKAFFVFVGNVVVQILRDRELSVELYSHVAVRRLSSG